MSTLRTRWAAIGAAVAVTLGAGGVSLGQAAIGSGDKPVFVAITPCRLVDTRPGDDNLGGRTAPLSANDTLTLQVTGSTGDCTDVPAGATAAAMNVTAIQGSTRSFLTVYPADAPLPLASNLNWNGGDPPTPNKVDVKLSSDGAVKITNNAGTVHVAADLVGYYTDHHHDDRYYTKSQVDDVAAGAVATQPWSESMPVSAAYFVVGAPLSWTIASGGSDGPDGITLNDTSYGRFWHGFTLPPAYQPGDDVTIRISWMADRDNTPGCTFRLEDNGTTVHRVGRTYTGAQTQFVGGPDVGGGSFPYIVLTATNEGSPTSWTDNIIQSAELIIEGADLRPGDQIQTAIARRAEPTTASHDTCTGGLTIVGLTAEPA